MRIIIVGGGLYGISVAEALLSEKHDIVIIDNDQDQIEYINSNLDVLAIKGSGADINILESAGIKKADMLIAMANSDETNIVACMVAKYCGVKTKIARLSDTDFNSVPDDMKGIWKDAGIDFIVNPESACAQEFESVIMSSGIIEEICFPENNVVLIGCKIGSKVGIKNIAFKKLKPEDVFCGIRFVAIVRQETVIIPKGEDKILEGDIIYFMCEKKIVDDVLIWLDVPNYVPERVIINGASDIGIVLAELLEIRKIDVKLIEQDTAKAAQASEKLKKTMVFNGTPTNETLLESMDVADVDAFVSVSQDDESNMLSCVIAKQMLSKKTFALIRKPEYVDIVSSVMKINRVINPRKVTINSILKFIRKGNIASINTLHQLDAEVMELIIDNDSKAVGKKIVDLNFPDDAIIGAIIEDNKMVFATGNHLIRAGSHVLVFLFPSAISKVESIFAKKLFKIF